MQVAAGSKAHVLRKVVGIIIIQRFVMLIMQLVVFGALKVVAVGARKTKLIVGLLMSKGRVKVINNVHGKVMNFANKKVVGIMATRQRVQMQLFIQV
ncbi:hypothetical protein A3K64_01915 [Candidatus Micrarchaeota archaeon RBG_16_36_9]|nr:MAG: hypothetical protein A3K64_01915 [Candidatus Micrarchaeota archaeon RBG_16_36_9]